MRVVKALVALAMLAPSPAAAQHGFEPIVLAPTSDWALDYGAEYCGLVRRFGTGRSEVLLQIANYGEAHNYMLTVVGDLVPRNSGPVDEIGIRMGSMSDFVERWVSMGVTGNRNSAEIGYVFLPEYQLDQLEESYEDPRTHGLPIPRDVAFERSITSLDVDLGDTELTLQTGPLWPALEAMRECRNNLLTSWGIDPAQESGLSQQPRLRPDALDRMSLTGPRLMQNRGQSARVHYRAMIAADGSVQSCIIQVPSPQPEFDETVCRGLRGGVEPARDANGVAVPSVLASWVFIYTGG